MAVYPCLDCADIGKGTGIGVRSEQPPSASRSAMPPKPVKRLLIAQCFCNVSNQTLNLFIAENARIAKIEKIGCRPAGEAELPTTFNGICCLVLYGIQFKVVINAFNFIESVFTGLRCVDHPFPLVPQGVFASRCETRAESTVFKNAQKRPPKGSFTDIS